MSSDATNLAAKLVLNTYRSKHVLAAIRDKATIDGPVIAVDLQLNMAATGETCMDWKLVAEHFFGRPGLETLKENMAEAGNTVHWPDLTAYRTPEEQARAYVPILKELALHFRDLQETASAAVQAVTG